MICALRRAFSCFVQQLAKPTDYIVDHPVSPLVGNRLRQNCITAGKGIQNALSSQNNPPTGLEEFCSLPSYAKKME